MWRYLRLSVHTCTTSVSRLISLIVCTERPHEHMVHTLPTLPSQTLHCVTIAPHTIYAIGDYHTPLWRALTHEIKFHKNMHAVSLLAPHVACALHTLTAHLTNAPLNIIPVPLHWTRERSRGFNQVTLVLQHIQSPQLSRHINTHALRRKFLNREQKRLNRAQRKTNISGAFYVPKHALSSIRGTHVIIVDDIITTGNTFHATAHACMQAGALSVTGLMFCSS